ncbi:type II toxin-antitoxin system RelE/ParE family toxin [Pelagicoccus sp. NFK12]|uniref:Type II toxin-antitoxin system RelE/ParE family toxin n=1 Tax=Pelagicoccus enzymogenes TaxID=2773457 RepID=A0A927F4K3_9BACT|nr:type II toxin-antitoxin system RelE/ParE family toxin [Pelagicoccus enzymogenes]MBD5778284.1 type II toxin-antitoxin system RelE/ParE family toxin [Pelagicoccus enzymogenes]
MDLKIVWTETALSDVESIVGYVADRNVDAARKLGADLISSVESLSSLPRQGRLYEPSREGGEVRELLCRGYRLFYRVKDGQGLVEIARVWHGARSEPRM